VAQPLLAAAVALLPPRRVRSHWKFNRDDAANGGRFPALEVISIRSGPAKLEDTVPQFAREELQKAS
jgi:hypothetical protein